MTEVPVTHDAHDLIPHGSLAQIVLDDKTYVLRITRAGKLILTK
ncbi:hemin uptake protein HemP [Pseudooceanicola sp. MF1-13]